MTNEQAVLLALIIGLLLVNILRFLIAVKNARAGAAALGDKNDNTAAAMARAQLEKDETLLYCNRRASHVIVGWLALALSGFFFLLFSGLVREDINANDLLPFSMMIIVFLGFATWMTFLGCRMIYETRNTFYFITGKRLCIRTITANGTKERDISVGSIKKIILAAGRNHKPKSYSILALRVLVHDDKAAICKPNGSIPEMAGVLSQVTGLEAK